MNRLLIHLIELTETRQDKRLILGKPIKRGVAGQGRVVELQILEERRVNLTLEQRESLPSHRPLMCWWDGGSSGALRIR